MFHNRTLNISINRLHERCLRIIYSDAQSSFEQFLNQDNSVSIHHTNIQALFIELFKLVDGTALFYLGLTPYKCME